MEGTLTPVCPRCAVLLAEDEAGFLCRACDRSYRSLRGIPDLRVTDDIFLSNEEDWSLALALDAVYDRCDFRGLLDRYFDLGPAIPPDLRGRQMDHILRAEERSARWLEAVGRGDRPGPVLDLGCGTGSFLSAVGPDGREYVGVDIAMRWLLLARKRLDEAGLREIRLVCGCAEKLPFAEATFEGIVAGDVIEHVEDREATLDEAHRVLRPGGRLFLASPNRFSLAPEPHVGVWGVGFLPRRWMKPYVRWARGLDFRAIHTLGRGEWRRLLARSAFGGGVIEAPGMAAEQVAGFPPFKRAMARAYNAAIATRPGRFLASRVGPLFHVVCTRGPTGGPGAYLATRPRSRRSGAPA